MASLIVWGDPSATESPLTRPVLARPILRPDPGTLDNGAAVPDGMLLPDLMVRAFRTIATDSSSVRIVNLSVCDPHAPFAHYPQRLGEGAGLADGGAQCPGGGVGGQLPSLDLSVDRATFLSAQEGQRRRWTLEALTDTANSRRLLTPAESINSLTVGALHTDAAGEYVKGARVDLMEEAALPSPISAIGRGFRRSVKPDVHAPGGRQLFNVQLGGTGDTTRLVAASTGLVSGPARGFSQSTRSDHGRGVHLRNQRGRRGSSPRIGPHDCWN